MKVTPASIQKLIREFSKLPGIGAKTSERFVYFLLRQPKTEMEGMARVLQEVREKIRLCDECYTFTEDRLCSVCASKNRDRSIICVVAQPWDVAAIEATGDYIGLYHVLGGVIDHAHGVGPQELRITELLHRASLDGVSEVLIATNPDMEGETTALFLKQQLGDLAVRVTRIARGLPTGANIEFADQVTLSNALAGRTEL